MHCTPDVAAAAQVASSSSAAAAVADAALQRLAWPASPSVAGTALRLLSAGSTLAVVAAASAVVVVVVDSTPRCFAMVARGVCWSGLA